MVLHSQHKSRVGKLSSPPQPQTWDTYYPPTSNSYAMEQTPAEPYLTASVHASQTELDMSDIQPFSLELTVTLHASKPVTLYTANTFLSPFTALRQRGIGFVHMGRDSVPEPRSTVHVDRCGGSDRPWSPRDSLTLEPGISSLVNVPFNSRAHQQLQKADALTCACG